MTDEVNNEVSGAEVEARQFGWVPEEEFKGNPEEWRDAEAFLRRGKEINGFLRKDMQKIREENQRKDAELAEIRATVDEFRKYHKETEARAYQRALADLKQEKVKAIEAGDGEKVVEIDEQIDKVKEAQKTPEVKPKETQTSTDSDYRKWALENTWYALDADLRHIAELFGEEVKASNPGLSGRAFLDEVTAKVKEAAPEKFENPNRKNASVSSSSDGRSPTTRTKKGYNDLPAEAKVACDKFVKQKLMTQDEYLAEYQWD